MDTDGNLRQLAINVRTEHSNIGEKVLVATIGIDRAIPADRRWMLSRNFRESDRELTLVQSARETLLSGSSRNSPSLASKPRLFLPPWKIMQIGGRICFSRAQAGGSLERRGSNRTMIAERTELYIQSTWRINAVASVRFAFPPRGRWHSIGHRARRNDFNPPGLLGARDRAPCIRSSKILLHAEVVAT